MASVRGATYGVLGHIISSFAHSSHANFSRLGYEGDLTFHISSSNDDAVSSGVYLNIFYASDEVNSQVLVRGRKQKRTGVVAVCVTPIDFGISPALKRSFRKTLEAGIERSM